MRQEREKRDAVICRAPDGSGGVFVHLSEEAAERAAWALTGIIAVLTLPIIVMAVMI